VTAAEVGPADHRAAKELAAAAGRLLVELRTSMPPGPALRDAGDQRSHELLVAELASRFPADRVLSEEAVASVDPDACGRGRVWIVDPLDGTREYGEPPRDDWAVHVALVVDGQPVVGAVALPGRAMVLATGGPLPAPRRPDPAARPRLLVSRTRPPEHAVEMARRMDAELVPLGSAGAKAMAVVLGDADVYAHAGGQYEWDSAAPVAVARVAGFHTSRRDGTPLVYDRPDPWLPDLLVCRPDLAATVLSVWAELG
jgi:3'(2'), 5'-bisphosphate nucleotidase